jgi:glutamine amidotransferase/cyclase
MNSFDKDGTNYGFDIELVKHISENVSIPVIASSGAGKVKHFSEVFEKADVVTALAAGILDISQGGNTHRGGEETYGGERQ